MRFVDSEFLVSSRGARYGPETHKRLERDLAAQEARKQVAALRQRREGRRPRTVRARVVAPFRSALSGRRPRTY